MAHVHANHEQSADDEQPQNTHPTLMGSDHHCQQHKMPLEILLHAAAKQGHKVPAGTQQQRTFLASLSHLHLNGLQLTQLFSLKACPKLQVLYIYDNLLCSINSLAGSRLLTHLYCQNNQLSSLQGVEHLPLLQKLYVQGNCLSCIDCLTHARHLEELHVSHQQPWQAAGQQTGQQHGSDCQQQQPQQQYQMRCHFATSQPQELLPGPAAGREQQHTLPQGNLVLINDGCLMQHCFTSTPPTPPTDRATQLASSSSSGPAWTAGLWFDPMSLSFIAGSLRVLCAAHCGITDPAPLAVLSRLQVLDLAGNAVASLQLLQPVLEALGQLQDLDLRGNPCTHCAAGGKYRDSIILAAADSLRLLDGEDVQPTHRAFLQALHSRKAKARQRQQQHQREQGQEPHQADSDHVQLFEQGADSLPPAPEQHAQVASAAAMGLQTAGLVVAAASALPSPRGCALGRPAAVAESMPGPGVSGTKLQLPVALAFAGGWGEAASSSRLQGVW